jgi:hypothetical protein
MSESNEGTASDMPSGSLGSRGPYRALKPDAQAFDEVRIVTVPRYKESGLSGYEWRISARIEFWRKGRLVHEERWGRVEGACAAVGYFYQKATDDGKAFFAGENDAEGNPICDQEGCSNPATVTYKLKQGFDRSGQPRSLMSGGEIRCFCDRHKVRGDCGREDGDDNYEIVTGEQS